jgi:hypothetical protein
VLSDGRSLFCLFCIFLGPISVLTEPHTGFEQPIPQEDFFKHYQGLAIKNQDLLNWADFGAEVLFHVLLGDMLREFVDHDGPLELIWGQEVAHLDLLELVFVFELTLGIFRVESPSDASFQNEGAAIVPQV